jgi:glutathione synthase
MDPIESITPYKDTTFALMLAAQDLGHEVVYLTKHGLSLDKGVVSAQMQRAHVIDRDRDFVTLSEPSVEPLTGLDTIMIRVDPPFDSEYLYATHLLERAERAGVQVINRPHALRDCNEKLFATEFAHLMPNTLVTSDPDAVAAFHATTHDVILKPLDGMGGSGIFRIREDGLNLRSILETLSPDGQRLVMAQAFQPEIVDGDRRVLVLHGQALPHVLARIPKEGETRGNLAAGGRGVALPISDAERAIADEVAPHLIKRGLVFVGLDVIGGHLTEINVTSPTCVREIDTQTGSHIAHDFFEALLNQ